MSKTFKISNGQIDLNPATGQPRLVEGGRKCAQDMANVLLQEYLDEQQYGSYLTAVVRNKIPFGNELLLRFYIADAINRLKVKQQEDSYSTEAERIVDITDLITTPNEAGTVGFYVAVSTEDGGESEAGVVQATQLNHLTEGF